MTETVQNASKHTAKHASHRLQNTSGTQCGRQETNQTHFLEPDVHAHELMQPLDSHLRPLPEFVRGEVGFDEEHIDHTDGNNCCSDAYKPVPADSSIPFHHDDIRGVQRFSQLPCVSSVIPLVPTAFFALFLVLQCTTALSSTAFSKLSVLAC